MANCVPELSPVEFDEFVKEGVVLVDFFSEWCMPCMMMMPIVEDIFQEFREKIKVGTVNIGEYPEIAKKYEINSIPHFIIFKEGKIIEQITGVLSQEELEEKISSLIS